MFTLIGTSLIDKPKLRTLILNTHTYAEASSKDLYPFRQLVPGHKSVNLDTLTFDIINNGHHLSFNPANLMKIMMEFLSLLDCCQKITNFTFGIRFGYFGEGRWEPVWRFPKLKKLTLFLEGVGLRDLTCWFVKETLATVHELTLVSSPASLRLDEVCTQSYPYILGNRA